MQQMMLMDAVTVTKSYGNCYVVDMEEKEIEWKIRVISE